MRASVGEVEDLRLAQMNRYVSPRTVSASRRYLMSALLRACVGHSPWWLRRSCPRVSPFRSRPRGSVFARPIRSRSVVGRRVGGRGFECVGYGLVEGELLALFASSLELCAVREEDSGGVVLAVCGPVAEEGACLFGLDCAPEAACAVVVAAGLRGEGENREPVRHRDSIADRAAELERFPAVRLGLRQAVEQDTELGRVHETVRLAPGPAVELADDLETRQLQLERFVDLAAAVLDQAQGSEELGLLVSVAPGACAGKGLLEEVEGPVDVAPGECDVGEPEKETEDSRLVIEALVEGEAALVRAGGSFGLSGYLHRAA